MFILMRVLLFIAVVVVVGLLSGVIKVEFTGRRELKFQFGDKKEQ